MGGILKRRQPLISRNTDFLTTEHNKGVYNLLLNIQRRNKRNNENISPNIKNIRRYSTKSNNIKAKRFKENTVSFS